MTARTSKPLPLPKTWLRRKSWSGIEPSAQEVLLAGRTPRAGTKANLRGLLLAAGWETEDTDVVLSGKFHPLSRLYDVAVEDQDSASKINDVIGSLKDRGFVAEALVHSSKTTTAWVEELWSSYTLHPWWTASEGGPRCLGIVSSSRALLERTTAAFMMDLWTNLGEEPILRLPVVRRFNLLSWGSAEALRRFEADVGPTTDVAVVYGGLVDSDHLHETLHYAAAMAAGFRGILLFELPAHETVAPPVLVAACRRSGFNVLLGVGGRNG